MKKILIIIIFIAFPLLTKAQLSGSGTYADPWSGTLAGDATWNGTKYINGDIIVDNEKLTISPGAIIIFLSETTDLIITGTGQLESDGNSGSMIRFTSDDDNDGNYGETGERWGHISFQSMGSAGTSIIDYCIIEFGDVSSTSLTPTNPCQYGGAIQADFSYVTISNCEIHSNKAGWGGGIFVGDGKNPAISNCYIHDNTATTSGGGIYFWKNSYSIFSNSIVTYNTSTGTGGGGGIFIGGIAKNVMVVNCVISHNTANNQILGHNIKIFNNTNSPKPQFINSIIWYPANSIVGSSYDADFYYCAIQDPPRSTYTGCISLNSLNEGTNPDGPFFSFMSGNSWPLQFKSPCRDAGTTPSLAIPNDYIGNSRIGPYDIGAYEIQYSRWKKDAGTTDWATAYNWDGGVPSSSTDVIIPAGATNYPTGSTTQDFNLGSGKQFIIERGAKVTLNGLTNNGIIKLNESSSGFASLIINSYSRGSGATEEIQLYLTGGGSELNEDYKWHYISTPVSSLSTDVFTGVTLDLAQFVESRPSTSLMQGWVAFDGYVYSTGQSNGPTFNSLTPGKGYNFWDGSNNTFTFGGLLNTSDAVMSLGYSGLPTMSGFNLLGNPFISGLDWNDVINSVYATYPSNTSKGLYFTRDNVQCTYIAGVGVPGDVTGIIPPMQGFFTKTYSTGNSITLPAAARTHDNIHPTYKGSEVIPLVRLLLKRSNVITDETVIRFDALAKSDLDNDFDAVKMFISTSKTQIYSSMGGVNYAINGQPFPENALEIPIVINLTKDTIHTISATQLQGLDDFQYVWLRDYSTGFVADLKITPVVTFSGGPGTINDRFVLSFTKTGIEIPNILNNLFNIYQANSMINIQTLSDNWDGMKGSVRLLDITGKTVTTKQDAEFSKNSLLEISAPSVKGLYIIELKSGLKRYVGKVVIK